MLQGDTVRLQCHFKTFDGKSVDPIDLKLTIYNSKKEQIEQIPLDDTHKENVGIFYYDYSPASELNEFIFEFAGSVNNKPILSRGRVEIKFNQ
ncbi:hypothetical protein AN964_11515 [Heyndrickxia shackletonii]|uniref:Uncharacterized protein n=1 Tax=Heyndrickxia shackletonii TaxID=157838 RepID=A0A0Q3TJD2_9BACI|nr:hypothetical protein [Heyndrickxia shackletonii]KQL54062.1 hypothetical protein AN964_11515 [Heyndrickxia shackletonii]NEZ02373.1 hypothetical protein [Heyndrickxia shackletonii]